MASILGDVMTAAYGHIPKTAGLEERLIVDAEHRIGASLPAPLREFYRSVGALPDVMAAHHQFVPIGDLRIDNGGLTFCRDHKGEMFWAVLVEELGMADPRVVQGQPQGSGWHEHCKLASIFLTNFSCWQVVNSMPAMGSAPLGPTTIKDLRKQMKVVGAAFGYDMISLVNPERGAVASILLNIDRLYLAARTDASLEQLEKSLSLDLDWA